VRKTKREKPADTAAEYCEQIRILKDGLERIISMESVVAGLRPELYGHAVRIAEETLAKLSPTIFSNKEQDHRFSK